MHANGPDVELYLAAMVFLAGVCFFVFMQWGGTVL